MPGGTHGAPRLDARFPWVVGAGLAMSLATLACTLLGWISRRLMSKAVRQEFA